MALTNTMGTYFNPFYGKSTDVTPSRVEFLQTMGTVVNATSCSFFAAATASDDFHVTALNFTVNFGTTTAIGSVYLSTHKIGEIQPVTGAGTAGSFHYNYSFGPIGALTGTTTTATVSLQFAATCTSVFFYAQGYRAV